MNKSDFSPRKGGSRKTVDLKNEETLEPFSYKELQEIFKVSHQTISERKGILGITNKRVDWSDLNNLFLLSVFVSSRYPHHTYNQYQNLYYYCLEKNLPIETVVFERKLMLNVNQLLEDFKADVIQRITRFRQQNSTGTFRVIQSDSESSTQD